MKRITSFVLCLLMVISSITVAFAERSYTLVFPSWMESDDYDPTDTEVSMGVQFIEKDADGNFVFSMSEETRTSEMANAEVQFADTINEMVNDETGLVFVSKVEYNDDLSQIDIYCENNDVGLEFFYAAFLPIFAWQYQLLLGYTPSEYVCTLTFYNPDGDTIYTSTLYDAELQELVESLAESSSSDSTSDDATSDSMSADGDSAEVDGEVITIEFEGYDIDFRINRWRLVEYYNGMGIEFDVTTINNTEYDIEIGMRDIEINGWLVIEDGFYIGVTTLPAGKKMKDSFAIDDWDMADVTAFEQIETISAEIFLQDRNTYSKLATVQINWSMDDLMAIPHDD